MPKPILFVLILAGICLNGLTAYADNGMYLQEIYGYVTDRQYDCIQIEGEWLTQPGIAGQVTLDTSMALVYDLLTGFPVHTDMIDEGMTVRASYGYGGYADTIWLNCDDPRAAAFKATVSENIYYSRNESVFLTHDGKYRITLSPHTLVIDPYVGLIGADEIEPGQQMFIWAEMVTASCPAQVYPEKVVIIYPY